MIFGAINIGTNSTKALFASAQGSLWRELARGIEVTGLGEGLVRSGRLAPDAMERTERAVLKLARQGRSMGAQRIWLAGTEALRQAANSHEFQRHLAAKGLEIQILTGQQEAALSFAGIKSALSLTGQLLAFDLGAGSLELMAGKDGELRQTASLPLGAGRLTERFFISDPPRGEELQTLEAYLEAALALQAFPAGDFLVGVGGTVTVLCQLARGQKEYSPDLAGAKLTFAQLERSYRQLSGLSSAERTALPGLANPRRAKLSLAGVAVIYKLLEFYRAPELVASQAGVLEGMMERLVRGD